MVALKVSDYVAPREDPLIHPGKRPPTSYLMDGTNNIFLMNHVENGIQHTYIETGDGHVSVNDFLRRHQVATLEERIPLIAYGTNPCPAQLRYKFGPIDNMIVPVIKGSIKGWDTVYKFIFRGGYAYAQLIPAEPVTVEAWVTLLDQVQYERMNLTEGVLGKEPHYRVGILQGFQIHGSREVESLAYIGNKKILLSPECKGQKHIPISIEEIPAEGRATPSLFQEEMLNHGLDIFGLHEFLKSYQDELESVPGSPGKKFAYFLNKHFILHNGGSYQCNRCGPLVSHIDKITESSHCTELAVSEIPEIRETLLSERNRIPFRFGDVWR